MKVWVKQMWSVVPTLLQSYGVAKEKIPTYCFDCLIEWEQMAFTELNLKLVQRHWIIFLTALVISCK